MGTFGCFEVTIGFGGNERVDFITYDTKGNVRCYEIKSSKEDFYSDAKWTFVGNYNYFVLTREVYQQVKDDIPKGIGVYIDGRTVAKRATRRKVKDIDVIKDSMIRSLYREFEKYWKNENTEYIKRLQNDNKRMQRELRELQRMRNILSSIRYEVKYCNNKDDLVKNLSSIFEEY